MPHSSSKHSESASTLLGVLFLVVIMAIIMGAVFMATTGEARLMKHDLDRYTAISYADGVLESLFDQWRAAMTSSTNLSATQKRLGPTGNELAASPFSITPPSGTSAALSAPAGMSLSSWSVTAGDPYGNALSGTSRPTLENGTNSSLLIRMYYVARATVSYQHGGSVTVQRIFTRAGTNIFNNFLYSAQPVTEFEPGGTMNVNGTIYAGGDLYLDSSNLNLQQDVSFTGSYTSGSQAPHDGHSTGNGNPTYPANDPPHPGASQNLIDVVTSELDQNFVSGGAYYDPGIYGGTNATTQDLNNKGYHELIEQQKTPLSSNPDPLAIDNSGDSERLANNADYTIAVDSSNNVSIYSGTNATPLTPSGTGAYNAIAKALITNTAFYDGRMGDTVRALTVDVGQITAAYNAGTIQDNNIYQGQAAKDGLLIYVVDKSAVNATITSSSATVSGTSVPTNGYNYNVTTSGSYGLRTTAASGTNTKPTSSFARGIRLINGGKLPVGQGVGSTNSVGGLTIASPNPVYIQGDYNTGSTTSGSFTNNGITVTNLPPSDGSSAYPTGTSAPNPFYGSGTSAYTRQASVIAADAVTILSNSWGDIDSNTSSRTPTSTTINTAIVAGNVPTEFVYSHYGASGAYSGGIENFPRLLENWTSSTNLTIYGSFALLYNSLQAIQPWGGSYYSVPSRHWFFDTTLQNYNPPGFPAAYTYSRGKWSTR